jgi:hypothetical protein
MILTKTTFKAFQKPWQMDGWTDGRINVHKALYHLCTFFKNVISKVSLCQASWNRNFWKESEP